MPAFADFLIAVEAEMNKVSWPTRHELIRASMVVMLVMISWPFDPVRIRHVLVDFLQRVGVLASG